MKSTYLKAGPSFKRKVLTVAVLVAVYAPSVRAGCIASGTFDSSHCDTDYVQYFADPGSVSLRVDGLTTASVELRPALSGTPGTYDQTLSLTGGTVIYNPTYSGVIMQSSLANRNATVTTDASVSITALGGFGGIWVRNDTSGNVTINNAATVFSSSSTQGDGISGVTNQGSVLLTNSGSVTSSQHRGLYADGGYNDTDASPVTVKIVNSGTVNAYQAGARAINYHGLASIENSGTVNSTTRQGLVAWSNSGPASIVNSGSVFSGDDNALHVMTEIGDISVVNSGTLTAVDDPSIVAARTGYSGIRAEVDMDPSASGAAGSISITNTASGRVSARDDYAISAATPSGDVRLSNLGSLTGLGGVEVTATAGTVDIDTSGSIVASGASQDGISVVSSTGGSIVNSGLISGARNSISVALSSVLSSGISNTSSGKLIGGLQIDSASSLTNNGLIVLKTAVDLDDIANTGSLANGVIGGNFTQGTTGTLHIAANGVASGEYSTLAVSGSANVSGTIYVDVKSGLNTTGTLAGVIGSSALTNNIAQVTDNSLRYAFRAITSGNDVDLAVIDTGMSSISQGVSPNPGATAGAARVFDAAIGSGNLAMQDAIDGLYSSMSSADLTNRVSQTLPLLTGNTQAGTASSLASVNRVIQARQDANSIGLSSGDEFYGDKNFWMKPFASHARQDDVDGISGYKTNTYGLVAGIDRAASPALRLGAALAYAVSDIDSLSSVAPQNADVDIYQLIAYGSYALDAQTEVNVQIDGSHIRNKGQRQIAFMSSKAVLNYSGQAAHVGAGIARNYALDSHTNVIPSVRFDYTWIKDGAYTESGAGALNLHVDERSSEAMILSADGKIVHQLDDHMSLFGNLGVGYDTLNQRASVVSAYAGTPGIAFVTYGATPSPWIAQAGVGLLYKTGSNLEVTGRYDLEHRQSFLNQSASVKLRWSF